MKKIIIIGIFIVLLSISANASVFAQEKPSMFGKFKETVNSFLVATHLKSAPKSKTAQLLDDIKLESEKLQDLATANLKTATTAIKTQFQNFKDYVADSSVAEKTQQYAQQAKEATMDAAGKVRDATVDAAGKVREATVDTAGKVRDATVDAAGKVREATVDTAGKVRDATVDAAAKARDATVDAAAKVRDSSTVETVKSTLKTAAIAEGLHKGYDMVKEKMGFKKPTLAQRIFGDKFLGRWESVKDTAEIQAMNFQSSLRQKTKDLKDKLNGVMSSEEVCYDEDVQTRAQALKEQINNLEARIADKAKQMINLFSLGHLFKASPIQGHHMHQPFLACNSCNRLYSLSEFLKIYDPQHQLNLIEEDFWTDAEVEEFWSGWSEYANHLKLHCMECGSSSWSAVEFSVSDEISNSTLGISQKTFVEKDLNSDSGIQHKVEL